MRRLVADRARYLCYKKVIKLLSLVPPEAQCKDIPNNDNKGSY